MFSCYMICNKSSAFNLCINQAIKILNRIVTILSTEKIVIDLTFTYTWDEIKVVNEELRCIEMQLERKFPETIPET